MFRARSLSILAAATVLTSCSEKLEVTRPNNRQPEVHLEAPTRPIGDARGVTHTLRWRGEDADGHIDHYLVVVGSQPAGEADAAWRVTTTTALPVRVERSPRVAQSTRGATPEPTIVGVRAVDNVGATSVPAFRAYFDDNIAPSVQIWSPQPRVDELVLPPTFPVRFSGFDPDGSTGKPVQYKFIVLGPDSPVPVDVIGSHPDLLRQIYAPTFTGWDSLPAESSTVTLSGLTPSEHYLLAITAIDEAGAYDPVFTTTTNVLRFQVTSAAFLGPRITAYNEMFNYMFPSGTYDTPQRTFSASLPSDVPITVHWLAIAGLPGIYVEGSRWVLDPGDTNDETPRQNKNDLGHWSDWSGLETSATIGPFHGSELRRDHLLYIEAKDNLGSVSLGIIMFRAIRGHASSDLLIVDDTRLQPDQLDAHGDLIPPSGLWPSAAELDTFMYARGGVPWSRYPTGTLSASGVFAGYAYDTLGTRTGAPDLEVPMEVLMQYRHVIWITDRIGALNNKPGNEATAPMTALRFMSSPGHVNTLAAYVKHGGQLWLVGGGAATASLIPYNEPANDVPGGFKFSSLFVNGRQELMPGRFMYDLAHWRSEIRSVQIRFQKVTRSANASGGIGSMLPTTMLVRSPATDPVPPLRSPTSFYNTASGAEVINLPNDILEDTSPSPVHGTQSTLDTLMDAFAPGLRTGPNPVMTFYHGRDNGPFLFSGFDLWTFRRDDIVSLVDAVLQGGWGMHRNAAAAVLMPQAPSLGRSRETTANELRRRPRTGPAR